jgi:hypothetical protein
MNTTFRWPVFLGVLLATAQAGAGQQGSVYLWVDKNGTPHYEDRPQDGTDVREMNLRYQLTNPETVAANAKQQADRKDAAGTREKQQADDKSKDRTTAEQTQDERAANCKSAKERAEKYDTSHRLYKPLPNGDRQYLSDKELDAARTEAHRTVDEWCNQ